MNKYQDKARGMLVGLAVGDALGAPVEFLTEPSDVHIEKMGDCRYVCDRALGAYEFRQF